MAKTILAQVDGFTPIIDSIVSELGLMSAAVFGKVWRYSQMPDGVCTASQERMAGELGITRISVNQHLKILVASGYLKDLTPSLVGKPHTYADTGKAGVLISFTANKQPVNEINTTCKNGLHPPVNEINTKILNKKQEDNKKNIEAQTPDFDAMTVSQYKAVPEIRAFIDATGWTPGSFSLQYVYDEMRLGIDPERLKEAFRAWCARGYKPANIQGYISWSRDGIPPTISDKQKQQTQSKTTRPGKMTNDEFNASLARAVANYSDSGGG